MKAAAVVSCILLTAHTAAAQTDTLTWSARYRRDLDSLRAIIAADHPGTLDKENPGFARRLDTAYQHAVDAAAHVNSLNAFRIELTRFVNAFQDEHLGVGFQKPWENPRDAGLSVAYAAGTFVVQDADTTRYPNAQQLIGATVISCDDVALSKLFTDRVLSWRGRVSVEADWYKLAPLTFVDFGAPQPQPPVQCVFANDDGTFTVPLNWRVAAADELNERVQKAFAFTPRPIGVQRFDNNAVVWVTLPTFAVNKDPELSQMRAAVDSVAGLRNRKWRLLVLDLRGNSGGSSTWGDEFARAIFGAEWLQQAQNYLFDGVYTEWRVSPGNLENVRAVLKQIAQRDGPDAQSTKSFAQFVDTMAAALARGQAYVGTPRQRSGAPRPRPVPVSGKIVLVTGATCFSACLDFLDRFKLHPAVVQVGQTTGVDTNYMENWGGPVSDLTWLGHPMKVYRNRRRANNQAYTPDTAYVADLYDTERLRAWITGHF